MNVARHNSCPDFAAASEQFTDLLSSQGWPTKVRWFRSRDESQAPNASAEYEPSEVEAVYEAARDRGLGVALAAVFVAKGATCAILEVPKDEREGELLMFAENGGLKLSVATRRRRAPRAWTKELKQRPTNALHRTP